jgi:DNA invertase Pin-like site-specific DNA recombinase
MATSIYVRISRDATSERAGVQRQRADCEELCRQKGWEVEGIYEDNDTSAVDRRRSRPGYELLIRQVRAGHIDRIVTFHLDRLYRQPRELEDLIDLAENGQIAIDTVEGSLYDLNSIEGRKRARDAVTAARYESEKSGWRISRAKLQMARDGKPAGGGLRPFGYESDRITVAPGEAALIREAADRVVAGEALGAICRDWDTRGITTTRGNRWKVSSLRYMLCRPRLAGLREYKGEILGDAVWERILDRETWERVRAVLTDPARRQPGPRRRYLLSGIASCSECGATLRAQNISKRGYSTYACRSEPGRRCGKVRIKGPDLDRHVSESVLAALDSPQFNEAFAADPKELAPDRDRLLTLETRLEELARDYASDRIGRREWLAARDEVAGETDRLWKKLDQGNARALLDAVPAGQLLRDTWNQAGMEWRQELVRAVVDEVSVHPAVRRGVFDPGRVEIVWQA